MDHFKPGIRMLSDIIFNNFETHEIMYENSIINRYHHFHLNKKQSEGFFMMIYCQIDNNKQRLTLCASRYHGMIPGEKYTVKYGKRSKILISILSDNGEELWDFPPDGWRIRHYSSLDKKISTNRKRKP